MTAMQLNPDQHTRIADICRRYGVRRLQMFGSAAIDQEQPGSDVDLLIEFAEGQYPSGFALVDMQEELSAVFEGRPVDLAFPGILRNPYRRQAIESQLRELFH